MNSIHFRELLFGTVTVVNKCIVYFKVVQNRSEALAPQNNEVLISLISLFGNVNIYQSITL